ncbi:MAG: hypothetical protein WC620_03615 [Methanoregula sp.]
MSVVTGSEVGTVVASVVTAVVMTVVATDVGTDVATVVAAVVTIVVMTVVGTDVGTVVATVVTSVVGIDVGTVVATVVAVVFESSAATGMAIPAINMRARKTGIKKVCEVVVHPTCRESVQVNDVCTAVAFRPPPHAQATDRNPQSSGKLVTGYPELLCRNREILSPGC